MANMNNKEKEKLNELINEMHSENNTELIRQSKHSNLIRDDILKINSLKKSNSELYENDIVKFVELCQIECQFLFNNYTNIFNKIIKNELDLNIMTKFLIVLKLIEDGKVDQHEGSVMIGKILKELYIDSAIKTGENLDKERQDEKSKPFEGKKISWREYKKKNIAQL
jgi:hypothetical protein